MTYGYSWDQLVKGILLEYLLPIAAFPIIFIFHTDNSIKGVLITCFKDCFVYVVHKNVELGDV